MSLAQQELAALDTKADNCNSEHKANPIKACSSLALPRLEKPFFFKISAINMTQMCIIYSKRGPHLILTQESKF